MLAPGATHSICQSFIGAGGSLDGDAALEADGPRGTRACTRGPVGRKRGRVVEDVLGTIAAAGRVHGQDWGRGGGLPLLPSPPHPGIGGWGPLTGC